MSRVCFGVVALLSAVGLQMAVASEPAGTRILPRPAVERAIGDRVILAPRDTALTIALPAAAEGPLAEGWSLLQRRVSRLGFKIETGKADPASVHLSRCDDQIMSRMLDSYGVDAKLDAVRARQAYHLAVETSSAGKRRVSIRAVHDWGLYYAVVSLCQLLDVDEAGNLAIPSVEILDFPEVAHRLAKVSAASPPQDVARFADLLPLCKISQIGLQYHGQNSRHPEAPFAANIESLCPRLRKQGTLESIVYFCPFRKPKDKNAVKGDEAYEFSSETDRSAYADYLLWIMNQGPHGIEVDYNDWPGSAETPISDVLNLACQTIKQRYPDACVLYCPPALGKESYRGKATPEMRQTLSRVPPSVWPLWTGLATLIREPLQPAQVEQWTKDAGRRPFLWVNRVGLNVKESFSQHVPGQPDQRVFAGDRLPRELNRLFEGVHFNTSLVPGPMNTKILTQPTDSPEALANEWVYLATAADFVWNPRGWDPAQSYARAMHFVDVMIPLQEIETPAPTAPAGGARSD